MCLPLGNRPVFFLIWSGCKPFVRHSVARSAITGLLFCLSKDNNPDCVLDGELGGDAADNMSDNAADLTASATARIEDFLVVEKKNCGRSRSEGRKL